MTARPVDLLAPMSSEPATEAAPRLAVVVSHPIQHFAPWFRETAGRDDVTLRVLYCSDRGATDYTDPDFGRTVKWDVPLLEGYDHEILPLARPTDATDFRSVDNPGVAAALEAFRPDVVMVFGHAYRTNWRVRSWTTRNGVPLLNYSDTDRLQRKAAWRRIGQHVVTRYFYRGVDGAFCVGDNNRATHAYFGLPPDRLFRGMLPVDAARLHAAVPDRAQARREVRAEHAIPDDAFVVVWCGKFIPRKRAEDLLAAARRAHEAKLPVHAVLVGDGPERPRIEATIAQEGLANVTLAGFVNQRTIPRYFVAADALAVTSSQDPHPLVVTEASTFGLPVLASDAIGCVGPTDTAQSEVNAIVFPCGNDGALFDAIERLRGDPALYRRMSQAASEIAATQDAARAAEAIADAVRRVLAMGPRHAAASRTEASRTEASERTGP